MASPVRIPGDVIIDGSLTLLDELLPGLTRSSLTQEDTSRFPIPLEAFRVWDAHQTLLTTAASDDLGITTGTWGTDVPYISAGDVKASSGTRRAGFIFQVPMNYVAGKTLRVKFVAGMKTTVASSSCTIDLELYKSAATLLVDGSDLVTTSATTINSTTLSDIYFDLTYTGLIPGDWMHGRVSIAYNDGATATAVIPSIAHSEFICATKG